MIKFCIAVVVLVLSQVNAFAQTTTIVDARTSVKDGEATYRYIDVFQVRGRWIVPDIGYIDFSDAKKYREWFVGAGYKTLVTKHVTVANELYFVQSQGSTSGGAKYVQPWMGVFYTLTPKLGGDTVFFKYLPLDDAGTPQWVVERAKLEYTLSSALKVGAGYSAYQFGDNAWQHKPLVTVTVTPAKGRFGSWEFWYQELPAGSQVHIRFELVKKQSR